ncbi:hypothetical protein [Prauserella muralis]|uniref:Uncharacterized protein n=1 Tax=Prauserella muralis TaxID=588067 RepID=A0A2V4AZN1_9PSEU|nr:hypothetical protein [Prauserella muralis]PXY27227.1 hypothetical protein BAY60_12240 [Prauserella muralis]TWE23117.1 hypothetical protein FHX69_4376 [Prauserella muralis]
MSWNDFYQRRDIIDAVLREARRDPRGPLPFARIPGAARAFGSEENLLLALQYKWAQVLSGRLRAQAAGPEDAADVPGWGERDHVDAVSRAWLSATREHPTLRAVLDAHADEYPRLRAAHEAELRMLAVTAGLAEPHEPREEAVKVGRAFVSLLRGRDATASPRRRSNPVGQLLRKLAATA